MEVTYSFATLAIFTVQNGTGDTFYQYKVAGGDFSSANICWGDFFGRYSNNGTLSWIDASPFRQLN